MKTSIYKGLNILSPKFLTDFLILLTRFKISWTEKLLIKLVHVKQQIALKDLKKKKKIKVAFFVVLNSVWKYKLLYELMEKDEIFEPHIFICPNLSNGEDEMKTNLNKGFDYFKQNNYDVSKTLQEDGKWLNVKKEFKPDIVFFTVPYDYTLPQYRITNFLDKLTCYVPYAFIVISELHYHYSSCFYSYLWRYFCESDYHYEAGKSLMINNGENLKVSGYPTFDLLRTNFQSKQIKKKKIVVWAPHHTISNFGGGLNYSCFEDFAFYFLELANKYSDKICFVLKPHPLLRHKLYLHDDWGQAKTDLYFEKWTKLNNCRIEEGDYIELFLNSDALIHDSASFMAEYLITEKPAAFIYRDSEVSSRINEFGNQLLNLHYKIEKQDDVESFLQNIVLQNNDSKKEERIVKLEQYFKDSYKNSPSHAIFNEIKKKLC
jgi:hypothetical protein